MGREEKWIKINWRGTYIITIESSNLHSAVHRTGQATEEIETDTQRNAIELRSVNYYLGSVMLMIGE